MQSEVRNEEESNRPGGLFQKNSADLASEIRTDSRADFQIREIAPERARCARGIHEDFGSTDGTPLTNAFSDIG